MLTSAYTRRPIRGTGIGLRNPHVQQVLEQRPKVPWLEILADNHVADGGLIPRQLHALREYYPITLHCVGMSLGGTDPLDTDYLDRIRALVIDYDPVFISDHLCFSNFAGQQLHDLAPLPYTREAARHTAERIMQVQDRLGRRLLVENVSSYLRFSAAEMSEAEFIRDVCSLADCELLLDLNNLYVNQRNLGEDARQALQQLPLERVRQVHLAGYEDTGTLLLDAHNQAVHTPVWDLFAELLQQLPDTPALVEWDNDIPPLETLVAEARQAEAVRLRVRQAA